jgi:hypothetical protein
VRNVHIYILENANCIHRCDSIPTVTTKKGSFAVSEDLSVPDEGKQGTSFSSYSSSFSRKGSIFDEPSADSLVDHTANIFKNSFGNQECSITKGAVSASPERQNYDTTAEDSNRFGKSAVLSKKKKYKTYDFNMLVAGSTTDCQSTCKEALEARENEVVNALSTKPHGIQDANNDEATVAIDVYGLASNLLKSNPKMKNKSSPIRPTLSKRPTAESEFVARTPLKRSAKVTHGSTRKSTTENGSPRSSKPKHGKTNSDTSSFGIETKTKKYEGYELTMNEASNESGESSHSEAKNQMRPKFFKRNKSHIDLKENTQSVSVHPATEVNILADPTHWPSLGEGRPKCQADQGHSGQPPMALLNPALGGSMAAARRNSMAAIISQKIRVIPAVPLLPQALTTTTETRLVSGESTKRYFMIFIPNSDYR